jgi:hypothetical protein
VNEYKEKISLEFREHINEMERDGVVLSCKQSKILERKYGVKIPPHFIAEYKYYERKDGALL